MGIKIDTKLELKHAQTVGGAILSILGTEWFIVILNVVKIKVFYRIKIAIEYQF